MALTIVCQKYIGVYNFVAYDVLSEIHEPVKLTSFPKISIEFRVDTPTLPLQTRQCGLSFTGDEADILQ